MKRQDLTRPDPSDAPPLGDSRAHVLRALQAVAKPVSVADVADRVGLHPNTARFHLDGLVEQGLAERETEQRDVPGRPRALYRASGDSTHTGRRSYRLLAQILASYLATQSAQPGEAAERAGEEWGRFLTERPAPFRAVDATAAMRELVEVLEEVGFAPEPLGTIHGRQILLHQCPFREVAEDHADVVCSVHLGLMRGVLSELNAPIEAIALEPFVDPSLCVTRLADVSRPPPTT